MALAPLAARVVGAATVELYRRFGGEDEAQTVQVAHVDSSCIVAIGWQPPGTISVTFKRGGAITYEYPSDYETFQQFKDAPSKGAFFNAHLR